MSARLLIEACGLSHREAAEYLGVKIDTVGSWFRARPASARPAVLEKLRALHARQRRAADETIAAFRSLAESSGAPDSVELSLSSDDHEARSKGWPCVGAERMAYALAAARMHVPVVLAPRGSTPSSAAAADALDSLN